MVKTPEKQTNMDGVKNESQGGVCGEAMCRNRQGRRIPTIWWCHSGRST